MPIPHYPKPTFRRPLTANNIVLAGIELGNEINWAAFNPEFPLPGEARFSALPISLTIPKGNRFAKGFLRYLKVLAVLKEVRDHSLPFLSACVRSPPGRRQMNLPASRRARGYAQKLILPEN